MTHTERLMNTAREYIVSNKQSDWVFAYAGGSVGRGDADAYSNLNLYIVVSSIDCKWNCSNVLYDGVTIHLNIQSWEGSGVMRSKPWAHRFLREARIVYDPHGAFDSLKPAALEYFESAEGRRKMLVQSQEQVQHYLQCLDSCIRNDDLLGASLAVQAAWMAATSSVAWMRHGACSNGRVLSIIQTEEPETYTAFRSICAQENAVPIDGSLMSLANYRHYLREQNGSISGLEPVMDMQIARKVERMLSAGSEIHTVHWLLRREAVRCYIAAGGTFRNFGIHYHRSPYPIQHHLDQLGFIAYSSKQLSELLRQVDRLADQAKRASEITIHEISRESGIVGKSDRNQTS
ncbi:hypothetical protein PCCS19_11630 [Paenibacillus sp. CCS19]|uniref:hypothetical protein n=1 Tax=Paenibacillus sp. CCS19 TaxID=3158387 RepID=UPI00256E92A2|nr:hypothetical protein [Paenibacillus cellulosilyticus]GMK38109.1 hypothetical protein PCCS19_11630 [Paenibacillus cellulosilyticus]